MIPARRQPTLERVVVETTRRCNLRCIHCAVSEENNLGSYDARDLPMDLFRKLLPILQKFKPLVQLSGHGETFLHPNFMEMLEEVARAGCRVTFQTNGTVFTSRNVEQIVRADVESIVISVDAASAELFQRIRRRARLDKIIENIQLINETKKRLKRSHPVLGFEFVAMRQNIHELPGVVKIAGELGVANFQVAELAEYNLTRGQSLANDPLMAEWASRARLEARKWEINLILPPNIPGRQVAGLAPENVAVDPLNPATYKGLRKTCKEPWESMFVQFDGEVRPCCVIAESYGDLSNQNFEEVWYGPKYQALRTALLSDQPFSVCVRCPFYGWEPIEPQQSRALGNAIPGLMSLSEPLLANPPNDMSERPTGAPQEAKPVPFFQRFWKRLVRKLIGISARPIELPDQSLLWLLNRLNSPDPRGQFKRVRDGAVSLPESCVTLLENGECPSARAFVQRAYRGLLGREADDHGLQGYVGGLEKGLVSREEVAASILSSIEFQRLLLREPDLSSLGARNMNVVYVAREESVPPPPALPPILG